MTAPEVRTQYRLLIRPCRFFSVRSFGIIGGGAVLFTASSLAAQAILPALGTSYFNVYNHIVYEPIFQEQQDLERQQQGPEQHVLLRSVLRVPLSAAFFKLDPEAG